MQATHRPPGAEETTRKGIDRVRADPRAQARSRRTQQKSCLHELQTMWLQPPLFSIVLWHLGHSLVLADIQLDVSESSAFFLSHRLSISQRTGACGIWLQLKHQSKSHLHVTANGRCVAVTDEMRMALSQSAPGQNLTSLFPATNCRASAACTSACVRACACHHPHQGRDNRACVSGGECCSSGKLDQGGTFPLRWAACRRTWYFRNGTTSLASHCSSSVNVSSSISLSHEGHGISARPRSITSATAYSRRQSLHTTHPQSSRVTAAVSSMQTGHSTLDTIIVDKNRVRSGRENQTHQGRQWVGLGRVRALARGGLLCQVTRGVSSGKTYHPTDSSPGPTLVHTVRRLDTVGLLEDLVDIARAVVPLDQPLAVPLEVLQENPCSLGRDLRCAMSNVNRRSIRRTCAQQ